MKKLIDLRKHLLTQVPLLAANPEQLLTYIEAGKITFSPGANASHRYSYQAVAVVTSWSSDIDNVIVPLLEWLAVREPGFNPDEAIIFEADILNLEQVDLIIKVNLTERVIVKDEESGRSIQHVIPGPPLEFDKDARLQIIVDGPLGTFQVPEQAE